MKVNNDYDDTIFLRALVIITLFLYVCTVATVIVISMLTSISDDHKLNVVSKSLVHFGTPLTVFTHYLTYKVGKNQPITTFQKGRKKSLFSKKIGG